MISFAIDQSDFRWLRGHAGPSKNWSGLFCEALPTSRHPGHHDHGGQQRHCCGHLSPHWHLWAGWGCDVKGFYRSGVWWAQSFSPERCLLECPLFCSSWAFPQVKNCRVSSVFWWDYSYGEYLWTQRFTQIQQVIILTVQNILILVMIRAVNQ